MLDLGSGGGIDVLLSAKRVGPTGKAYGLDMTDEMLAWQTERFLGLALGREGHIVHLRPELVVEVAFDGVQRSSQYPGGVALRFARVKRYRPEKPANEADTIDSVRRLLVPGAEESGEP